MELTPGQRITLAIAILGGLSVLVAIVSALISLANERKRTQPIVIAHEERSRHSSGSPLIVAEICNGYLTNEGGGPASNVRFGVRFGGERWPHRRFGIRRGAVRFAYRHQVEDPAAGNFQVVVVAGERRPKEPYSWPVLVDIARLSRGGGGQR